MAIKLVTGAPGAGKSFYMVNYLTNTYYQKEKGGHYIPKPGVKIIANIEGLKLDHLNLDEAILKSDLPAEKFFTIPYQEKIVAKYGSVVYVIDECQRWFDQYFRDKDCIYFFEYHRHLGLDIYLMSQTKYRICRAISDLAEYEIKAVRRLASIFGEFKYSIICGQEILDKKMLKKSKEIFSLYKSMDRLETEKIKNPMIKYLIMAAVVIILGGFLFTHTFWGSVSDDDGKPKKVEKSNIRNNNVVAPTRSDRRDRSDISIERIPVRVDFITKGEEVFVYSPITRQLLPYSQVYKKIVISKSSGVVRTVYALMTTREAKEYILNKKGEIDHAYHDQERPTPNTPNNTGGIN